MYKLAKMFTSRDGMLEPDSREYGISAENLAEIKDVKNYLGGATHIFVRIDGGPSQQARFFTRNNALSFVRSEKPESGWAEYELEHGSGYAPERGEIGWWNVEVEGAPSEVVEGIGLPHSWHVSHFLIFSWQESDVTDPPAPQTDDGPTVPEQPPVNPSKQLRLEISISTQGYAATIQLFDDGTYTLDEIK